MTNKQASNYIGNDDQWHHEQVPGHKPGFVTVCTAMWGAAHQILPGSLTVQHLDVVEENDHQLLTGYSQMITGCGNYTIFTSLILIKFSICIIHYNE